MPRHVKLSQSESESETSNKDVDPDSPMSTELQSPVSVVEEYKSSLVSRQEYRSRHAIGFCRRSTWIFRVFTQ